MKALYMFVLAVLFASCEKEPPPPHITPQSFKPIRFHARDIKGMEYIPILSNMRFTFLKGGDGEFTYTRKTYQNGILVPENIKLPFRWFWEKNDFVKISFFKYLTTQNGTSEFIYLPIQNGDEIQVLIEDLSGVYEPVKNGLFKVDDHAVGWATF